MAIVIFTAAAEADLAEAVDWYEARLDGLGDRLIASVGAAVRRIESNPRQFPLIHRDARRVLIGGFP